MKKTKNKQKINNKILFFIIFLLTIAWILSISALLVVWLRQPMCPEALLGPPEFPVFLFVFIGAFVAFCFGGLYAAYRVAFSN